jgi:hypothetical protein
MKKVMSVQGKIDAENRQIEMVDQVNGNEWYQRWELIYVKDWKGEPTKGQWNRDWGFKVDTDFHIISMMGKGRYVDYINNRNLIIKTQNGRRSQRWYFHQPSRTIRSREKNQSIDIYNSGKGNHLQYYSTSSNWW